MFAVTPSQSIEKTDDSVYYKKPTRIDIANLTITQYMNDKKIETLIHELQNGPLVAYGKFGPSAYFDEPLLKSEYCKTIIHGWEQNSKRSPNSGNIYVIILGAKKTSKAAYVFFTLAKEIDCMSFGRIRALKPSSMDERIFVNSHENFKSNIGNLFTPFNEDKTIIDVFNRFVNVHI